MELLNDLISSQLIYSISMTVVHSLWQGAILVILMNLYLKYHHNETPGFRYQVGFNTLMLLLVGVLATFGFYQLNTTSAHVGGRALANVSEGLVNVLPDSSRSSWSISSLIPFIGLIWMVGVLFLSLRLSASMYHLRSIKASLMDTTPEWLVKKCDSIIGDYNVTKRVGVAISNKVSSPMVIGFFKPIIIFPVATINALTASEAEMILRHELAHIMRNDFIHNIIIRLAEIIMFYHPGVRWIIRLIETERENHCDDLAITGQKERITYAKTLVKVKELEVFQNQQLALAFSNNKKSLLNRITRILNHNNKMSIMKSNLIVLAVLISSVICVSARSYYVNKITPEATKVETKSIQELDSAERPGLLRPISALQDTSKEELENLIEAKEREMREMRKELRKLKGKKGGGNNMSVTIDSDDWDEQDWEEFGERMERMGERIARKFDSPEWEEKMNNLGERISEKFESGEFEEKMERLGERLSEKFESEEWQEKMERMGDDISINFNGEELETSMEELAERLEQTFESDEFHEAIEGIAVVGADLGIGIAETTMNILSSIVDGEDFHIEGDINFNEKDWENFGDNLENTIESIMEGVDQALQGVDDNIAGIGSEFVALEESMQSALKEDGFYKNGKVSLELEEGAIKINGKRQSIQMEDKYKKIILDAFSVDSEDAPYFQYKFSDKKGKVKNSFSIDNDKKRETKTVKRF